MFKLFGLKSRIELEKLKNSSIAPFLLNDAYNKRTRERKKQARGLLSSFSSGRSMVEMLGVLAIIGVLSVGGLEGYSRAMEKYKFNKQTEQLNTILSAVSRYQKELRPNDGSKDSIELVPYLKKLNEIPPEMYIKNNENYISDVFTSQYRIYYHNTNYVGILMRFKRSSFSDKICRNIYMTSKSFSEQIYALQIGKESIENPEEGVGSYAGYAYGDATCTKDRVCLKDLTQEKADQLCNQCSNENSCIVYVIWR